MSSRRRVLLDENLPRRLRLRLPGVEAITAEYMGWKGVRNGDLVRRARAGGFEVLVTADRPLAKSSRAWAPMGCVHVTSTDRARLLAAADQIDAACRTVCPGEMLTVQI